MNSEKGMPILAFWRVLLGAFYIMVGGSKLLAPYQNFLYVVESYQVFSPPFEQLAAHIVPWIEFFLGIFLVLGLWLKNTLLALMALTTAFLILLAQAIIRGLPIDHCGCFGSWLSVSLKTMMAIDSCLWLLMGFMLMKIKYTLLFSLDNYWAPKESS